MTKSIQILQKCLKNSLTITMALILLLSIPKVLLANETNPKDPPPKTTGTSGGSRAYERIILVDFEVQQLIDKLLIANLKIVQG